MKNSTLFFFGFLIALISSCGEESVEESRIHEKVIDFEKL
tara:strand:- start:61702 stop:61821 length:120 start_codon:yes stop_codon:yes gene_type:complete